MLEPIIWMSLMARKCSGLQDVPQLEEMGQ